MSAPTITKMCTPLDEWAGPWVRLIGSFAIYRCEDAGRPSNVDGRKARALVMLLAVHYGRLVGVDHIVDALWADRPPRRPEAGVSTLVSRIRATHGHDLVAGDRNGYRLARDTRVDLHEAAALIAEAEALLDGDRPELCLGPAELGLSMLNGGPVLAEAAGAPWAEPARAMRTGLLRRGRHTAAEAALHAGDPHRARRHATAAITTDPLDEAAYRVLIRTHAAAGDRAGALDAYQRLRSTLAEEFGIDPAPATRDLHRAILTGEL